MAVSDLERRVDTLESIEAIKRLKHEYCAYCDAGYDPDGIASQFVEDGVWDGGEAFGRYEGREAIHAFFAGVSSQIVFAGHLVMNERIDVDADNDSARRAVVDHHAGHHDDGGRQDGDLASRRV